MDDDRELFIQQLVAALQENSALSSSITSISSSLQSSCNAADVFISSESAVEGENSSQEHTGLFLSSNAASYDKGSDRLAPDAYVQLQYDFPQAQDASIEALAELYRRISIEKSMCPKAAEVPVTAKLLDNVAFLNDKRSFSNKKEAQITRSSEASGLLAASLLLLVFRMFLEEPEDARVDALLSSLGIRPSEEERRCNVNGMEQMKETRKEEEDEYVEKFAAQEDPDDLSEVYEGHLPEHGGWCNQTGNTETLATTTTSRVEKLQYLASHTFSSSFESVSVEKWEQWRLDDNLVAIIKLLVDQDPSLEAGNENDSLTALYGPCGEWTRYLYVLRDRVLRYPNTCRDTLWRLKELIEYLQTTQSVATGGHTSHHIVYHVLAELALSREFQQDAVQRAQQGMTLVIQELIPLITQDIHQIVAAPSALRRQRKKIVSEHEHDVLEASVGDGNGDDELAMTILQLLHFMLFASANTRTTTEKLHESGMLRTLLLLLPTTSDTDKDKQAQFQDKCWCPALLRLFGECALWHAGFAAYITRVPKFAVMLSALQEYFVVEQLLFGLAFHQHGLQIETRTAFGNLDLWKVFTSEVLFPSQCESYLDAMKKLQDTVLILDCLEKVLAFLRPAMQKELQYNLQQIYLNFGQSFEYPTFTAADDACQQQRFNPLAVDDDDAHFDASGDKKDKKEKDRCQIETLQFTRVRNKLRQSIKSVLALLSSGSSITPMDGRVSSKFD
ncbi:unnamed protein product [Peronospora belbahrii]|uniref:Uncharacterized protein n=1 Tax=Peronospora belbahrii TaxID=622444 RepID=A0AAU9KMB9_9STRA|nr:unnamed protein product [Peronospora belbahrii]CAH0519365.1 unnamed protein product [Peronospora belbahrii]